MLLLFRVVLFLLAVYAVCGLAGCLGQKAFIFPATRKLYRDPSFYKWAFDTVFLPVNGHVTHAWWVPLEDARGTVLFSHGNAGNIADRLESIGLLRSFGFSVLAYDYGGYGESTGRRGEKRCYADIEVMWDYLTETRGIPPEEILLFGRSLGGGPTADLASKVEPAAVILESTFLSTNDIARDAFPWLPVWPFIVHRFPNKKKMAGIRSPLLIIHSPQDRVIPYRHGKALFELATEPKTFLEIHGDHNDGFVLSEKIYRAGWEAFLKPILPRR